MSQNKWLSESNQRIERMKYVMEESIQRGSFDTQIDLREILTLISESINEIKSLQQQVDVLKVHTLRLKQDDLKRKEV